MCMLTVIWKIRTWSGTSLLGRRYSMSRTAIPVGQTTIYSGHAQNWGRDLRGSQLGVITSLSVDIGSGGHWHGAGITSPISYKYKVVEAVLFLPS